MAPEAGLQPPPPEGAPRCWSSNCSAANEGPSPQQGGGCASPLQLAAQAALIACPLAQALLSSLPSPWSLSLCWKLNGHLFHQRPGGGAVGWGGVRGQGPSAESCVPSRSQLLVNRGKGGCSPPVCLSGPGLPTAAAPPLDPCSRCDPSFAL